jgi:Na+/proline symporter
MAASLCFGLATSTILVLVLVPTFYLIYARLFGIRGVATTDSAH